MMMIYITMPFEIFSPCRMQEYKYIQTPHPKVKLFWLLPSSTSILHPIDFLIVVPCHDPETVDAAPLSLRGRCIIITCHIGIIIVIALPLRGFALSFALRIRSLGGAGAPDGFRTLIQCWWLNGGFRCSWSRDSGGSSRIWRFRRIGDSFKGAAHALIVFELFGAVGGTISAKDRGKILEGRRCLPYTTDQLSVGSEKVRFSDHNSNVFVRSQMIKEVSRSDWRTGQLFDLGVNC